VLFDGLRAAYYPLADDGTRNFVDLNIPDEIVERIEVLKDGASSTYGADAVAGVVTSSPRRMLSASTAPRKAASASAATRATAASAPPMAMAT
jgi:iron complex outermembrane receptor protein